MAGQCKVCGYQAGIFNLANGVCKSCAGKNQEVVSNENQKYPNIPTDEEERNKESNITERKEDKKLSTKLKEMGAQALAGGIFLSLAEGFLFVGTGTQLDPFYGTAFGFLMLGGTISYVIGWLFEKL